MAFHEEFTIKNLLSEVNLILDTEECDKNFWFIKKKLVRIVEMCRNGRDKGSKGIGIGFWRKVWVAQGVVGEVLEMVQGKSCDFGKILDSLRIVKDCMQDCVDCWFKGSLRVNCEGCENQDSGYEHFFNFQNPWNAQTKDLIENFQMFFSSVSLKFSMIYKNLSKFNEALQILLKNFNHLKRQASSPFSSLESKSLDLQIKIKTLESENNYLESTLKSTKDLLSATKKEKDSLSSIVSKAKEKLQRLKISNIQKTQFIPNKTIRKSSSALNIQKTSETIFISSNKSPHNQSIKSLFDMLSSLQILISSENLEKTEKFLKLQNFFIGFSEKLAKLEKDLNIPYTIRPDINKHSKPWVKSELKLSNYQDLNNNFILGKLLNKKNKIKLHKEQILVLKARIRELQKDLEVAKACDFLHLRELWWSFAKDIPVLDKKIEETFSVFTRMLGFTSKDILSLNNERTLKKPRLKFGLF